MKSKTKMKKWIIGPIFVLLITNGAYGAIKEATWTEFKPKAVKGVALSGSMGLGYQSVEDVLGRQKQGVNTNTVITFTRPMGEGIGIDGNIQLKKQAFTIGSEDRLGSSLRFKSRLWEVNFSSDLSNLSDIVEMVENQSRADAIKAGIKLYISENFPLTVSYSKSYNKNLEGSSTTEEVSTEEYGLLLGSKFGRIQTNFNLNYNETLDPVQDSKSRVRSSGVNSIIPLTDIFQLSLGIQPSNTETMPIDESEKVTSEQVNYTVGLTSKFSERLRLMTMFGLINSLYKSETTETRDETFNQNYGLFYQPTPVLSLNTALDLSQTKEADNSQGITANINYIPEGSSFFGQTGLGFQANRTQDNTGVIRSENATSTLNTLFRFTEVMNLGSNFTHSTQITNPLTGEASSIISDNLSLKFIHKVFKDLSYGLSYVWNDKAEDSSRDIINGYQGDITYNFRLKERELPISLSQIFNHSRSDGEETNTQGTKVSIQISITSLLSTSYSYGINTARTSSGTYNQSTENTIGLRLKGKARPFSLTTKFSFIDSTVANTQSINASLAYSMRERLSLNLNFIQDRTLNEPTIPTNITAGLIYNF